MSALNGNVLSVKTSAGAAAVIAVSMMLATPLVAERNGRDLRSKPGCELQPELTRTVTKITGPNALGLDDGTEVVLAGALLPSALDANDALPAWPPALAAARKFTDLVVGQSVALAAPTKYRDRYGRRRAQAFRDINGRSVWLQAYLVGIGQARVDVTGIPDQCAASLLRLEARARAAKLGLWRHAAYQLRRADRPREILKYRSSFQIVEGIVQGVSVRRTRAYINFGKNHRRDFTAGLPSRLVKRAAQGGRALATLQGKAVRIRGWITWRGGPYIDVRSLHQIESLPSRSLATAPRTRVPASQRPTRNRPDDARPDAIDL